MSKLLTVIILIGLTGTAQASSRKKAKHHHRSRTAVVDFSSDPAPKESAPKETQIADVRNMRMVQVNYDFPDIPVEETRRAPASLGKPVVVVPPTTGAVPKNIEEMRPE